jgi:predicted PurR-regulated permease PerM
MKAQRWGEPVRYITFLLLLCVLVAVGWYIRELYQPLIIAGLIAYVLMPGVNFFKKRLRMGHKLSVNLVYFLSLAVLLAIPATLVPILLSDLETLTGYLVDITHQIEVFLSQPIKIGRFELNPEPYVPNIIDTITSGLKPLPANALHLIEATSRNFLWFLVIVVTVYYLLLDWDKVREWFIRQPPEPYRKDARHLFLEIKKVWAAYLRGTLALMFIVAIAFSIVWLAIGLPGALVIGILTGLLSIIPEIGPMAATLLAVAVALVEGSNYLPLSNIWFAILVIGIYALLINIKNVWLRPRIMGRSVHIHEGLVFIAIIAAVIFQGILGALIIVPVMASAVVIGRYLRHRIYGETPFVAHEFDSMLPEPEETEEEMDKEEPSGKHNRKRKA